MMKRSLGFMFAARLETFRELAPWTDRMMTSAATLRFTLAATHRVIDRVHDHAAHMRAPPLPARPTGFAARDVHVIDIADLADRRVAVFVNPANLARRHFHQRITGFAVAQRRLLPGAARNLSAAARSQFDIVNARAQAESRGAEEHCRDRARHPLQRITFAPTDQAIRREDVTHLAIRVLNKSDARGAIRIVLDRGYFSDDAVLPALEIDLAILLLVATADVARSQSTVVVSAADRFFGSMRLFCRLRRLGDLLESRKRLETQRRREWTKILSAITN